MTINYYAHCTPHYLIKSVWELLNSYQTCQKLSHMDFHRLLWTSLCPTRKLYVTVGRYIYPYAIDSATICHNFLCLFDIWKVEFRSATTSNYNRGMLSMQWLEYGTVRWKSHCWSPVVSEPTRRALNYCGHLEITLKYLWSACHVAMALQELDMLLLLGRRWKKQRVTVLSVYWENVPSMMFKDIGSCCCTRIGLQNILNSTTRPGNSTSLLFIKWMDAASLPWWPFPLTRSLMLFSWAILFHSPEKIGRMKWSGRSLLTLLSRW